MSLSLLARMCYAACQVVCRPCHIRVVVPTATEEGAFSP